MKEAREKLCRMIELSNGGESVNHRQMIQSRADQCETVKSSSVIENKTFNHGTIAKSFDSNTVTIFGKNKFSNKIFFKRKFNS